MLSACETGRGRLYSTEGIVGLMRAFMYAGAPRVLVSLWRVDDDATQALMREFYELCARRLRPGGYVAQWLPLHGLAAEDCHQRLLQQDLDLGESFRTLRRLWQREGEVVAEVGLPDEVDVVGTPIVAEAPHEKYEGLVPVIFTVTDSASSRSREVSVSFRGP